MTTASAEQNEKVYLNNGPVAYYSTNGSVNGEMGNGTDGRVYIDILEDRYGNTYSSHLERWDASEKWNYSGGNIFEVKMKNGKLWWSFLPARDKPVR
jgi:hypothetical protein